MKYYVFIFTFLVFSCSLIGSGSPDPSETSYWSMFQRAYNTRYDEKTQDELLGITQSNPKDLDKTLNNKFRMHQYIHDPLCTHIDPQDIQLYLKRANLILQRALSFTEQANTSKHDNIYQQKLFNFLLYNANMLPPSMTIGLFSLLNETNQEDLKIYPQTINLRNNANNLFFLLKNNDDNSTEVELSTEPILQQNSTSEEEEEFEDVESSNET